VEGTVKRPKTRGQETNVAAPAKEEAEAAAAVKDRAVVQAREIEIPTTVEQFMNKRR